MTEPFQQMDFTKRPRFKFEILLRRTFWQSATKTKALKLRPKTTKTKTTKTKAPNH